MWRREETGWLFSIKCADRRRAPLLHMTALRCSAVCSDSRHPVPDYRGVGTHRVVLWLTLDSPWPDGWKMTSACCSHTWPCVAFDVHTSASTLFRVLLNVHSEINWLITWIVLSVKLSSVTANEKLSAPPHGACISVSRYCHQWILTAPRHLVASETSEPFMCHNPDWKWHHRSCCTFTAIRIQWHYWQRHEGLHFFPLNQVHW